MQQDPQTEIVPPLNNRVRVGPRSKQKPEPELRIDKSDDQVQIIHFRCSCGEQFNIKCVYENN